MCSISNSKLKLTIKTKQGTLPCAPEAFGHCRAQVVPALAEPLFPLGDSGLAFAINGCFHPIRLRDITNLDITQACFTRPDTRAQPTCTLCTRTHEWGVASRAVITKTF